MAVRVLAGLGNPGARYDGTRHNVGFVVLDALARQCGATWTASERFRAHTADVVIEGNPVRLVKPQAYMNCSGGVLGELFRFHKWKPEELVVAVDEYQIPVGSLKVSTGGGAGGHNGLQDIIERLGAQFIRFRIGIAPEEKPLQPMADFVLGRFNEVEQAAFTARLDDYVNGLRMLVSLGPALAMNTLNRKSTTS
jgi:PTH1 family peptidyl-tRNA hydrolase